VRQLNTKLRQLRNDDKDIMWEGVVFPMVRIEALFL